jgi:hypothetical protein
MPYKDGRRVSNEEWVEMTEPAPLFLRDHITGEPKLVNGHLIAAWRERHGIEQERPVQPKRRARADEAARRHAIAETLGVELGDPVLDGIDFDSDPIPEVVPARHSGGTHAQEAAFTAEHGIVNQGKRRPSQTPEGQRARRVKRYAKQHGISIEEADSRMPRRPRKDPAS